MTNLDFDQFWADRSKSVLRFKAFGEWAQADADIPFAEIQAMTNVDLDNTEGVQGIAVRLFGQETYDHWIDKGILFPQLTLLVMWALFRVQGMDVDFAQVSRSMKDTVGKALTSLGNTGEPSKPDSSNTIDSTTPPSEPSAPDDSTSS